MEEVLHDLRTVESAAGSRGLELNHQKCELISLNPCSIGMMLCAIHGLCVVIPRLLRSYVH